ncbi:MAG: hypothetical protein LQ340_007154 [Diploschistes diacapsis]|nr:MAG: hypothetical protein LQ340_007154 [Diploschistes diacapsis]
MILVALFVVIFQPDHSPHDHNWTLGWVGLWENSDWTWAVFATSLFKVFYYYAGLKNVNYILNDVKDPVRTLKAVSITVLLTTCVLYALINITYFVVPFDEIKQSGELIAALFFERSLGPSLGKVILPVVVTLSNVGNVMVTVYALGRLNQEVARQGFLPFSDFLASSKPFGAPLGGLLVQYILSLLVILLPPSNDIYSLILDVAQYPRQFYALALCFGLL